MAVLKKNSKKLFTELPHFKKVRLEFEKRRALGTVRYLVLIGGRGSAKTRHGAEIVSRDLFGKRNRIGAFRKIEARNEDSFYTEFIEHIKTPREDGVKISPAMFHIGKSPKLVETRNRTGKKGILRFYGLYSSAQIKGVYKLDTVVVDEADQTTYEDFLNLDASIRHEGAVIILIANPPHEGEDHWIYQHFLSENASQDVKDMTIYMHSNYKDNPFISEHARKSYEALAKTNPYEYQRSILGLWVKNQESLVYPSFEVSAPNFRPPMQSQIFQGLDFGHTDPCAMVRLHYWKEKGEYFIFVEKEKYKSGLDTQSMINYLSDWRRVKEVRTHADSSHPMHIKDLKLSGFNVTNVKKGQGSVLLGINFIKSCKIIVHPECENFLKEIRSYAWKKNPNGGFMYGVLAEGQKDHLMDAFRYALEAAIAKDYMTSSLGSLR